MPLFEDIGMFCRYPTAFITNSLGKDSISDIASSSKKLMHFSWIYFGTLFIFLYMYPELWYYPDSWFILNNSNLFISKLALPYFFLALYWLAYMFIAHLNQNTFTKIEFRLAKRYGQFKYQITEKDYRVFQNYTILPFYLWGIFCILRMYFSSKIHVSQYYFPYFSWTLDNILLWNVFAICIGIKWGYTYILLKNLFKLQKKTFFLIIGLDLLLILGMLLFVDIIGSFIKDFFIS